VITADADAERARQTRDATFGRTAPPLARIDVGGAYACGVKCGKPGGADDSPLRGIFCFVYAGIFDGWDRFLADLPAVSRPIESRVRGAQWRFESWGVCLMLTFRRAESVAKLEARVVP